VLNVAADIAGMFEFCLVNIDVAVLREGAAGRAGDGEDVPAVGLEVKDAEEGTYFERKPKTLEIVDGPSTNDEDESR
jgi:hypothetical protein